MLLLQSISWKSLTHFLATFIPLLGLQLVIAIPYATNFAFVGSFGNARVIATYGLCSSFVSILMFPILTGIMEATGVAMSKCFGQQNYPGLTKTLWQTLSIALIFTLFYAFLSLYAGDLLVLLNVEPDLGYAAGRLIKFSNVFAPFSNLNMVLQTFMISQKIKRPFLIQSCVSICILLIFGWFFIVHLEFKESGFIPARFIQEMFTLSHNVFLLINVVDRRYLQFIPLRTITDGLSDLAVKVVYSTTGMLAEVSAYQFLTFIVTQLHSIDDLAVLVSWMGVFILVLYPSIAIGSALRVNLGHLIEAVDQDNEYTHRETIANVVYATGMILLWGIFMFIFSDWIASIFINHVDLASRLAVLLQMSAFLMYGALMFYPLWSVFRLLELDRFFVLCIYLLYLPCLVVFCCTLLFLFNLGINGALFGYFLANFVIAFFCIYKIFWLFDWNHKLHLDESLLVEMNALE